MIVDQINRILFVDFNLTLALYIDIFKFHWFEILTSYVNVSVNILRIIQIIDPCNSGNVGKTKII